jgi:TRAP-type mannitol/chloroaromatic compound transport system permease large subunit
MRTLLVLLVVALPTTLVGGGLVSRSLPEIKTWLPVAIAAVFFLVPLSHFVSIAFRSRSPWLAVDLVGLLLVVLGVATGYCYLVFGGGELGYIVVDAWEAANKELLLSIPLYVLAGNIMARGTIASRLIRLMQAATAPVPAGLAIATVLSCAVFAAVSGSGTVTLLAIGSVMYPALVKAGYPRHFSLGLLCAGGTLGIVIPPSHNTPGANSVSAVPRSNPRWSPMIRPTVARASSRAATTRAL